jgi:[protein-PII] uridylyltransferase
MVQVVKPRRIIDRKALNGRLDELVSWSGYTPKTQSAVLEIFKSAHQEGWNEVKRRFEAGEADGPETTRAMAYLIDQVVRSLYEFATERVYPAANPTKGEQMSLVATGGYGRGEMAPFSDIDLMFLLPYKLTPRSEQVVEFILYMLWDLGL